jgi:LPXTG-motif cell wall-anchored protein
LNVLGIALNAVLGVAQGIINPVLSGLSTTLAGPLGDAIDAIAQLDVNHQVTGSDGSFTQTALRVGLGSDGSIAAVNLANATVGPNAGIAAVPIANQSSLTIAGLLAILVLGVGIVVARRRRVTSAA